MSTTEDTSVPEKEPATVLEAWLSQMATAGCPKDLAVRVLADCAAGAGEEWADLSPTRQMRYASGVIWALLEESLTLVPAAAIAQAVKDVPSGELVMPTGSAKLNARVRANVSAAFGNVTSLLKQAEGELHRTREATELTSGLLKKAQRLTRTLEASGAGAQSSAIQPGTVSAHHDKLASMTKQVTERWRLTLTLLHTGGLWYAPWDKYLGRTLSFEEAELFMKSVKAIVDSLPGDASPDLPAIKGHLSATLSQIDPGVRDLLRGHLRWTPAI